MIVGTGIDLVEVARVERALTASYGARLRSRVFTRDEQEYCESRGRRRAESYAARFAAKEAVMKALGVGWGADASWREVEVRRDSAGAPHVELTGTAAATAERLGVARIALSLTHAAGLAVALAVAETLPPRG